MAPGLSMKRKLFITVLACSTFPLNPGSALIRSGLPDFETRLAGPQGPVGPQEQSKASPAPYSQPKGH